MNDPTSPYPIDVQAQYPVQSSRLLSACAILWFFPKTLLIIPHAFVLAFVGLAGAFVAWIAQWLVLFGGVYPQGMFDFALGAVRWQTRVNAWIFGLVDRYPPFSLR